MSNQMTNPNVIVILAGPTKDTQAAINDGQKFTRVPDKDGNLPLPARGTPDYNRFISSKAGYDGANGIRADVLQDKTKYANQDNVKQFIRDVALANKGIDRDFPNPNPKTQKAFAIHDDGSAVPLDFPAGKQTGADLFNKLDQQADKALPPPPKTAAADPEAATKAELLAELQGNVQTAASNGGRLLGEARGEAPLAVAETNLVTSTSKVEFNV